MFRMYDNISIHSFKKNNLRSLSSQLVEDIGNLHFLIRKVLYLRVISHKALILSLSLDFFIIRRCISVSLFSFLNKLSNLHFFFFSFYNEFSNLYRLYLCNICLFNSHQLPVLCYLRYISYYRYLMTYSFYFITSSFFSILSTGVASLPTRIKKFTVLRSPHSDKKSREQFELRTHKRVFQFPSCFASYYNYTSFQHSGISLCTYSHTYHKIKYDSF